MPWTASTRRSYAVPICVFLLLCAGARAVPPTWSNGNGKANNPLNWLNLTNLLLPPGLADKVIIANGNVEFDSAQTYGALELTGGNLFGNATLSLGNLEPSKWLGGSMTFSSGGGIKVNSGSILEIDSSSDHDFGGSAMLNQGTVKWKDGALRGAGSTFTNSGTFEDTSSGKAMNASGAAGGFTFNNSGTYRRNGAGVTYVDVAFNNTGTVELDQGELHLRGGGSSSGSGSFLARAGTKVRFTQDYTVGNASKLTGDGDYILDSGTLTLTGSLNSAHFEQQGGAIGGSHSIGSGGKFSWKGGHWNGSAAGLSTTIASGGTLEISTSADHDFNQRSITNQGLVKWQDGALRGGNGSVFTNDGTFEDTSSGRSIYTPTSYGGAFSFTNNGRYERNGAGTTYFDVAFNNNGVLEVIQGDVEFRGGGTLGSSGSINAAGGSKVYFRTGHTIGNAASLSGAGEYHLTDGALNLSGNLSAAHFEQTGGTLAGNQKITGGNFYWKSGRWNSTTAGATTEVDSGGSLLISTSSDHEFNRRSITNKGTVKWQDGSLLGGNGSVLTNESGALFEDTSSGRAIYNPTGFGGSFSFINRGTYKRNAAGATYFDVAFDNDGLLDLVQGDVEFRGGGTLGSSGSINAASGTKVYFRTGHTITNAASLAGAGEYHLTDGALNLSGNLSAAHFEQTGGTLVGNQKITGGNFHWKAGRWNSTTAGATTEVDSGGSLLISTSGDHEFNRRSITNKGTVKWQDGSLLGGNGSVLTNESGALFEDMTSGRAIYNPTGFGGSFNFVNRGTYKRNAAGATYFDVAFDNDGLLDLVQGEVEFRGGGTLGSSGSINAASGTKVYFRTNHNVANGASLGGSGSYYLTDGVLSLGGALNAAYFEQTGGALAGSQTIGGGNFHWKSGNWNSATAGSSTEIAAGGTLHVSSSADHDFNRRAITNRGAVKWSDGALRGGNGSVFTNETSGLFEDTSSGRSIEAPSTYGGSFRFVNKGTYRRNGSGVTNIYADFENSGTLDLQAGSLVLHGETVFSHGAQANGVGLLRKAAGLLIANGTLSFANFEIAGGTVTGNHTFKGHAHWAGGNFNSSGTTTIDTDGEFEIDGSGDHDLDGRAIVNHGLIKWNGGKIRGGNGASITNYRWFYDYASSTVENGYTGSTIAFTNASTGYYYKVGGGTTTFNAPFVNAGVVAITNGSLVFNGAFTNTGSLYLNGGSSAQFANPLAFTTGYLAGAGSIQAPSVTFTDAGVIAPGNSIGVLSLTGNLSLANTTTLLFDLGGTTQGVTYDFLSVGGNVALNGTLGVLFANGFQSTITSADTFTLLQAGGALSGTFANIANGGRLLTLDGLGSFQVNYGGALSGVTLSNFQPIPEPSTYALLALGAGALVAAHRRRRSK